MGHKPDLEPADSERLICAVLRREAIGWPGGPDAAAVAGFLGAGRYHGVLQLLAVALQSKDFEAWPRNLITACRGATRVQAMHELAHRIEIDRVLRELDSAGVKPLLLKGTALAYSHYPSPALRPRGDTDLLIPEKTHTATAHTLYRLGYVKGEGVEGKFISSQATWSRTDEYGATHVLDVHWRINNSQVLAKLLAYDELAARAAPLAALGPCARALVPEDALLVACIHRAGHLHAPYHVDGVAHLGIDRLIWLYDIHLLVSRMSAEELDRFAALAVRKRIQSLCHDALLRTGECFATPIPSGVLAQLNHSGPVEPSARYLTGGRIRLMVEDLRALDAWADRVDWVRELAFPPARYMRWKYRNAGIGWLPILYLRRGLTGIARLILPRVTDQRH
jgi:hypothetical protein